MQLCHTSKKGVCVRNAAGTERELDKLGQDGGTDHTKRYASISFAAFCCTAKQPRCNSAAVGAHYCRYLCGLSPCCVRHDTLEFGDYC